MTFGENGVKLLPRTIGTPEGIGTKAPIGWGCPTNSLHRFGGLWDFCLGLKGRSNTRGLKKHTTELFKPLRERFQSPGYTNT
jgi:hypothetical protein